MADISKIKLPNNVAYNLSDSVARHDIAVLQSLNGVMFGFKINKNDTNPNTRVEYLYDAIGMTPAHMDFTNDVFDYGSWGSAWFVRDNRPVALKYDGTVDYELNHDDFTKKLDGTSSDVTSTSYSGNFMSEMPLVYVKRWDDSNYNYVVFSDKKIDENFKAYAHTNTNGIIQPKIYLPMFKGSIVSSKLRSLARQFPTGSTSGSEELTAATACGEGWQTWDWAKHELIADLLTLISKSTDNKTTFGNGDYKSYVADSSKQNGKLPTGGYCSTVGSISTYSAAPHGQFYGTNGNSSHVTVFYIEDFWGNRYDRCQGLHLVNNVYKVKMTPPYNLEAPYYITPSGITPPSSTEGWLKNTATSEYGSFPTAADATETTGYCSYFSKNSSGNRLALIGGNCNNSNNRCGSRCLFVNNEASNRVWSIGSSPCYCTP